MATRVDRVIAPWSLVGVMVATIVLEGQDPPCLQRKVYNLHEIYERVIIYRVTNIYIYIYIIITE